MLKAIEQWINITKISKQKFFYFVWLTIIEIICYIFLPVSYANIVSSVTAQNTNLSFLWASINFMTQLSNLLITHVKHSFISRIKKNIIKKFSETNIQEESINNLANYTDTLNSSLMLTLKLISILIVASIYSLYLMFYVFVAILTCLLISLISQLKILKSVQRIENLPKPTKPIFLDVCWHIFTLLITLIIINLIGDLEISLTAFLLFSTFINTHLTKPGFRSELLIRTKQISLILKTLNFNIKK